MLKDITIGQYYPTDSVLHKLDPRVKLMGTLLFVISLFPYSNISAYIFATIFLATLVTISRIPLKFILKGLKPIVVIIVFTAVCNIFMTPGTDIVFTIWNLRATYSGIYKAAFMVIRFIYLIIGASLMTYTTTPNKLTDGIEKSLAFLNKVNVPVHDFALMMSLALRFIPILMEEADKIIKAQSSRGADFEEGPFFDRMKNMVAILIPLLVSATRRANDLALAMDSRCYNGGTGRSKMKPLKYENRDYAAYVIMCTGFIIIITAGHFDFVSYLISLL